MPDTVKHIIFTLLLYVCTTVSLAQSGFFIPQKGKIFFNGSSATIFSDVLNQGQLGIGKGAVVNFKGRQWENTPTSRITDESIRGNSTVGQGGMLRFILPDSSQPVFFDQQQYLIGGYNAASRSGPTFPNLSIANPWGVKLLSGSTKIRNELNFTEGNIYVNDNILVVGDRNPGTITGYNEDRFVVTGSSENASGFLLREKLSRKEGQVVFPVGTADGLYTPAALNLLSRDPDDFYVRVFDGVKARLRDGQDLTPTSVNKVWQIGKLRVPGEGAVNITLQHRLPDEGLLFIANRTQTYVSQYASGSWDQGDPHESPGPGILTTGAPLSNSGTNTRTFRNTISPASYFSKFAGFEDTAGNRTNLWFSAYRNDYQHVYVYWTTNPEIRNMYFVVQRRLSNEAGYSNVDTVISKAPGGLSFNFLDYNTTDPNNYTGVSYYRLMMVDYNGNITYSQIVAVGPEPQGFGWTLWPNPSPGRFFVGISRPQMVKKVYVWDIVGHLLRMEWVSNRGLIEMHLHVKGTYVVGLISEQQKIIETKKLIIIGD
ncbi:MAG TPA: T9SS type A sorting domain-containing protein [Puia sp.]|nr:T9SS type A sorting domain-containing protein [Puia sp.]